MKKIIILLLTLLMVAGCSGRSEEAVEQNIPEGHQTEEPTENPVAETADKILVIYFSREGEQYSVGVIDEGNTYIVADMIAKETGADMVRILPAEDNYPTTYKELTEVALEEQRNNERPAYIDDESLHHLDDYKFIFIGAPVWWGDWPMIMYTLFDEIDLSGKKIAVFSTHEGSGLSGFDVKLQNEESEADVVDGLAIRGSAAQNDREKTQSEVSAWIKSLNIQ